METKAVCNFKIKDQSQIDKFWQKALSYKHFENMYLILRNLLYTLFKGTETPSPIKIPDQYTAKEILRYFSSRDVVRALAFKRVGGKQAHKVDAVKEVFSEVKLFEDLQDRASELQPKNIYKLLGKIDTAYKSFFTNLKEDKKANPPKPKKLSRVHRITIPIDQDCLTFKKKNKVGLNIGDGMEYLDIKHEVILKIVKGFENVQAAELICKDGDCYLSIIYNKTKTVANEFTETKFAGLDLGIKNTAAIFIDDKISSSLLIGGDSAIRFNANNNRKLAHLYSRRDLLLNEIKAFEKKNDTDKVKGLYEELKKIKRKISKLYEKRQWFYYNYFHKLSRRILEDLCEKNVTDLVVSRNLGEAKQDPNATMGKIQNQKFHQIPIIKLLDYLELNGAEYGISVHDINEAYTSKTSSISGKFLKGEKITEEDRADAFNGKRVRRSLFFDKETKKYFHADINAAVNHIRKFKEELDFRWLSDFLWKLANPIKHDAYHCYLDRPLSA